MTKRLQVIGPPGCGKTYYVAQQIERAVRSGRYNPDDIVVASLTRAAAKEAAGRVALPEKNVATLHSLCYRAMGMPKLAEFHTKEFAEFTDNAWRLKAQNTAAFGTAEFALGESDSNNEHERIAAAYGTLRHRLAPRERWPADVQRFADDWEAFKRDRDLQDFTDLIAWAATEAPNCPTDPAVLFIDEAQDLSALEVKLLNRWAVSTRSTVVVGDPYQAIYIWRGSDPDVVFTAEHERKVLAQSYRVPQAVHRFATQWIKGMPGYQPIEYHPTPEPGQVKHASMKLALAEIAENAGRGESSMLLATCAYQLDPHLEKMGDEGILFSNRYRRAQGKWNPHKPGNGRSAYSHLLSWTRPHDIDEIGPEDAVSIAKRLKACTFRNKVAGQQALVALCESGPETGELVRRLAAELKAETWEALNRGDTDFYRANLRAQYTKGVDHAIDMHSRWGRKGESMAELTTVGTIHSVKGGEADHVYLMPDLSSKAWRQWSMVSERHALYRLFYVAATRARKTLTLVRPSSGLFLELG